MTKDQASGYFGWVKLGLLMSLRHRDYGIGYYLTKEFRGQISAIHRAILEILRVV